MFRKEAIFRRMKHYSREGERCQSRITQLERQKSRCEAGLAAMETCWQQVNILYGVDPRLLTDSFALSSLMSLDRWSSQNSSRQSNWTRGVSRTQDYTQ